MIGFEIRGKGDAGLRDNVPMPKLHMNEVLIKIKYCGICGSDTHQYHTGIQLQSGGKPYILGHELVGQVEEINCDSALPYNVGDWVTGRPYFSCGICDNCRNGRESICEGGIKLMTLADEGNGAYAEYCKLPAKVVFPLKKGIDLKTAALTEPLAVAVYDVRMSGLQPGQSVLISGGGVIGGMIAVYCRHLGAKVCLSEPNPNRTNFLKKLGFQVFDPIKEDVAAAAKTWNDGKLFDVTFECCGAQKSYDLCLNATRRGGTFMFVGVTTEPREFYVRHVLVYQLTVMGVNMYETKDYYKAVRIINSGELDAVLPAFITHVYPLEQAYEAYMKAMDPEGSQVKVLLDCEVTHE
jgi:2-desacetyl-2-hydroxyethyl bacteriochlorophyllide A dehydrogenase